jgi:transcriptional regulator with XRE-family HTH domain
VARAQAHQIAASFIRDARKQAGLTTAELAARIGVSAAYLSDAQSYRSIRKIPLDLLILVANACDGGTVALAFEPQQNQGMRRRAIDRFHQRVRALRRREKSADTA